MVLSWLARSRRSASVDDLVARRRYGKAVEALREEFGGRQPTVAERLRLADLLVLANRGSEALPILLGVADEQTRFGFADKAVEALRRASEVEPGRPDVGHRIAALRKAAKAPAAAEPTPGTEAAPDWGAALDGAFPAATPSDANGSSAETESASTGPEAPVTAPDEREAADPVGAGAVTVSVGAVSSSEDAYFPESDLEPEPPPSDAAWEATEPELHLTEEELEDDTSRPLLTEEELEDDAPELHLTEEELEDDAPELHLTEEELEDDAPRPLLTEEELEDDGPRLPAGGAAPETHAPRPLFNENETRVSAALRVEAKLRGATAVPFETERSPEPAEDELHEFLLALSRTSVPGRRGLGATLFADFPREEFRRVRRDLTPHLFAPGDVVVGEGDPGDSLFLIASGSVRILILGGHGQPFDIRRLDAGDFFGEVAVLSGRPRTATVVAATPCQALEIGRTALEHLLRLRPAALALMAEVGASRARCQEEEAVRSLPPDAADPERAAASLQAHFGSSDWSPRVRTHLARLLLDSGRQDDALAILAGVAQDLARRGQAQKAIALLKKVERVRRRGLQEIELAPLRPGRRRSARHAPRAAETSGAPGAPAPRAATGAAFREWVGLLIRATDDLAARSAPPGPVEEVAERDGDGQGRHLAGKATQARIHRLRRDSGGDEPGHQHAR
jgi:CRP-like cAMP-binding protein